MKNKKRFMALGLTGAMLMSMGTTAFAASGLDTDTGKQPVRTYTIGDNVAPDQSADVDIHGEIFDAMNTSEGTKPTDTTGSGDPTKDSEYGDEDTYGNAYLVVTAPTDLTFQAAGDGAATLLAGTGTITNQSYYQPDPDTEGTAIPVVKEVKMVATASGLAADGNDQFTINKGPSGGAGSDVSNLNIKISGVKEGDQSVAYADGKIGTDYTLKSGTVASDQKTVAPSIAKITFEGTGDKGTVTNSFGTDYKKGENTKLTAESELNLNFSYQK